MSQEQFVQQLQDQLGFRVEEVNWGEQKGCSVVFVDSEGASMTVQSSSNTWPWDIWELCRKQAIIIDEKDKEIAALKGEGKKSGKVKRNDSGDLVIQDTGGKL